MNEEHSSRERQLALLAALARGISRDEARRSIAAYRGYTDDTFRRTFERDVHTLREGGYPVVESEGRYTLATASAIEVPFSRLDVGLIRSILAGNERGSVRNAASIGLSKLMAVATSEERSPSFVRARIPSGDAVTALARAVQNHARIRFDYSSSRGLRSYVCDPAEIFARFGAFYVAGMAEVGTGWEPRTFRVDRFVSDSIETIGSSTHAFTHDAAAFEISEAYVDVRVGCLSPIIQLGRESADFSRPIGEGWTRYRFSGIDKAVLFENLVTYRGDLRLAGPEAVVREWENRLAHLEAIIGGGER